MNIAVSQDAVMSARVRGGGNGPVTRARLRRSRWAHLALCALGAAPWIAGLPAPWQALGWGLWLPGMGFVAVGGWATALAPVALLLFGVSFIAWFGSGMILAPLVVWAGSALLAAAMAGPSAAPYAPVVVPVATLAALGASALFRARGRAAALARRAAREAFLPAEIAGVRAAARPAPPMAERELQPFELSLLRYVVDRALQPVGELRGFDRIDQFQTAALRYQLNQAGWALAVAQRHHTPNFHGYLSEGQRRIIDQYLQHPVWGYWSLENAWGNLSLDGDPAKKDNIMLTGYLPVNVLLYTLNTGDRRYAQPGSLSFMQDGRARFSHDIHSIVQSLLDNYSGKYSQAYCLYPCEPNWIYPACNFRGATSIRLYDTVFGTDHFAGLKDRFRAQLQAEFTRPDGGVVPLRSKLTGHELPFPVSDAINVKMLSPLYRDLAERTYAVTRHDDMHRVDGALRLKPPTNAVDFGNYRPGTLFTMDGYLGGATEMGDAEAVAAIKDMLLAEGGPTTSGGVSNFTGSNMANLSVIESWLNVSSGWRDAILTPPDRGAREGPVLAEAPYPAVLVAHAVSDGEDLRLVLHPGGQPGPQPLTLARLTPGRRYRMEPTGQEFTADGAGGATVQATLDGRTPLRVAPV